MNIGTFSALFSCGLLVVLWEIGIKEIDILIIALLMLFHMVFQIFARGNVSWMEKPNFEKIGKKMPLWVYSLISSAGLLSIVFIITKATSSI